MGKDQDVRNAVEDELNFAAIVDASDIRVKNFNGKVALSGTMPSYPQRVDAAAAARRAAVMEDDMSDEQHGNPVSGQPGPT
jgi:osmotically-inducible protein OsmY